MSGRAIPDATVARLPVYHRVLVSLAESGSHTVSSEELATACGVTSAKLRKDLSYLGSYGTRGVGYDVQFLAYQIARELGLTSPWGVVVVGVGVGNDVGNWVGENVAAVGSEVGTAVGCGVGGQSNNPLLP